MKQEFEKLTEVQKFLESCGLKVWREVIPDECLNWLMPYRVDLIFEIPNYGLIGVEGKHLHTHKQGGKYAEAYIQIRDKYRNKKYFNGKRVRRWCIFAASNNQDEQYECFIKTFLNKLGMSYFQFSRYTWKDSIVIDALTPNRIDIERSGSIIGIDKNSPLDYGAQIK